jgi:hypothetical protein
MQTRPFASSEPWKVVMNGWTGVVMASGYPFIPAEAAGPPAAAQAGPSAFMGQHGISWDRNSGQSKTHTFEGLGLISNSAHPPGLAPAGTKKKHRKTVVTLVNEG